MPATARPRLVRAWALVAVSSVLLAACGGGDEDAETSATTSSAPRRAVGERASEPVARKPIDPATTGTIRGFVRFEGEPPERPELAIGAGTGCPGHDVPQYLETVIVEDGGLENVYVYVKQGLDGWVLPEPPAADVVLDQRGCRYRPHVLALQVGQTLRVRNSDPLTHNVNVKAPRNNLSGNRSQGLGGADLELPFTRREHGVHIRCDIHPWMGAWVFVEEHPFFAVSGAGGAFEIAGLPPGEYVLEAIHEDPKRFPKQTVRVTVPAGGTAEAVFRYAAS